jgi:hypothetical protein
MEADGGETDDDKAVFGAMLVSTTDIMPTRPGFAGFKPPADAVQGRDIPPARPATRKQRRGRVNEGAGKTGRNTRETAMKVNPGYRRIPGGSAGEATRAGTATGAGGSG